MTKPCLAYGMYAGGTILLSFWFLVGSLIFCVFSSINEAAEKYQAAAQVERDKAEELHQAQLEWYQSQTNKETP